MTMRKMLRWGQKTMMRNTMSRKTMARPQNAHLLSWFHNAIGSQCVRKTMARWWRWDFGKITAKRKSISKDWEKSVLRVLSQYPLPFLYVCVVYDTSEKKLGNKEHQNNVFLIFKVYYIKVYFIIKNFKNLIV